MAVPRRCAVVQGAPFDGFGDELAAITANLPGDAALSARPGVSALGWLHKDVTRNLLCDDRPLFAVCRHAPLSPDREREALPSMEAVRRGVVGGIDCG